MLSLKQILPNVYLPASAWPTGNALINALQATAEMRQNEDRGTHSDAPLRKLCNQIRFTNSDEEGSTVEIFKSVLAIQSYWEVTDELVHDKRMEQAVSKTHHGRIHPVLHAVFEYAPGMWNEGVFDCSINPETGMIDSLWFANEWLPPIHPAHSQKVIQVEPDDWMAYDEPAVKAVLTCLASAAKLPVDADYLELTSSMEIDFLSSIGRWTWDLYALHLLQLAKEVLAPESVYIERQVKEIWPDSETDFSQMAAQDSASITVILEGYVRHENTDEVAFSRTRFDLESKPSSQQDEPEWIVKRIRKAFQLMGP